MAVKSNMSSRSDDHLYRRMWEGHALIDRAAGSGPMVVVSPYSESTIPSARPEGSSATGPVIFTVVNDTQTALRNFEAFRASAVWDEYVTVRLDQLCEDQDDLSVAPSHEVINRARNCIRQLLPPNAPAPSVLPSCEGGVDFVWHKNGWNVEIGVEPDDITTVWTRNKSAGDGCYGDLAEHREYLLDVLRLLSED